MTESTTRTDLEAHLIQHGIPIDLLPTFFQLAALNRGRPDWRTTLDEHLCACIRLLGAVRERDLIRITGVDQSTINRRVRALQAAGAIRVTAHPTGTGGKPAKWLQPPASADLDATTRVQHLALAEQIIAYRAAWLGVPPAAADPAPPSTPPDPLLSADQVEQAPAQPPAPVAELAVPPPAAAAEPPSTATHPPPSTAQPTQQPHPASADLPLPAFVPFTVMPAAQPSPPLWYRTFYFWMAPLIALGLYSYAMNERAALVAFATQTGIPLLWLVGAFFLIALLIEYRETLFAGFAPVEHRPLVVLCALILAIAVVQSGLWAYARALWHGTAWPPSRQSAPLASTPIPLVVPEPATIAPTPCALSGPARVTAARGLRLRLDPDTTAPILVVLPPQTVVTLRCVPPFVSDGIEWVQVEQGELSGWVAATVHGTSYLARP